MADTALIFREELQKAGIDITEGEVLINSSGEALYVLSTHGSQAIPLWRRLRERVSQTEHWPLLVGEQKDLDVLREQWQSLDFGTTKEILQRALTIDAVQWFERKHEEVVDELLEFGGQLYSTSAEELLGSAEEFRGLPRGLWPTESSPCHEFQIPIGMASRKPLPQVYVALVPTATCWHVPAHLRFGAWNECPQSEEHVALMRFWQQNFGAEVVGITSDVVEMLVGCPPSNRIDALKLAKQQYLYCQDIVDQGTQTLEVLAASLLGGTSWFFWWD